MKNVVKNILKNSQEKVFTNEEMNIIIKKDYNPLKVNYKIYKRGGLFMKGTKEVELEEVMKELNIIEKIFFKRKFIKIYKKGIAFGINNK